MGTKSLASVSKLCDLGTNRVVRLKVQGFDVLISSINCISAPFRLDSTIMIASVASEVE